MQVRYTYGDLLPEQTNLLSEQTNMYDTELASFTADGLMFSCLFTSRLGW